MKKWASYYIRAALAAAGLLAAGQGAVADVLVPGGSFETPLLFLPGNYQYNPPITLIQPWTFTGNSGVTQERNPPLFGFNMQNAPDGGQSAFIQDTFGVASSISQTITVSDPGQLLSFFAEGREYSLPGQNDVNPLRVLVDGVALTFGGSSIVSPTTIETFTKYVSDQTLSVGSHLIVFETATPQTGTPNPDHTTFIDAVGLTAVPEPSPMILAGAAATLSGLGVFFRKRKTSVASV
jgi:hypothetical protein